MTFEIQGFTQSRGFRGEVHLLDDFRMQPRELGRSLRFRRTHSGGDLGRAAMTFEIQGLMQSRGFRGEVYLLDDFRMQPRDWAAACGFATLTAAANWAGQR